MAEEKTVQVELLADGIRLADEDEVTRDYVRGDLVTLPVSHAERLRAHGSVGDKGSVKKAEEAQRKLDELEVQRQRYLAGQVDELDEAAAPKPGPRPSSIK